VDNPVIQERSIWSSPVGDYARFERATGDLDPPFAIVDVDAFWNNARLLIRRASGLPIRLASKSVRCRALQERVLATEGFRGTLAFTLPEALWLQGHGFSDLVVAYPTTHRSALRQLARLLEDRTHLRLAVMVDGTDQLDAMDAAIGRRHAPIQVCMDVDAGWWLLKNRLRIGAKRSPVHTPEQAVALARAIDRRDGFRLVGIMAYEAQIAGVGDSPPGRPLRALGIRAMQSMSAKELSSRRRDIVDAVRSVTPLEFVNGGGTGSLERTASESSITEVAAGSGLFAPTLFDAYRTFRCRPAAFFALSVVRRPSARVATVLGGGYLASGPGDGARLPAPYLPQELRLDGQEGAGEVQTPLLGKAAEDLRVGDRVYFRHAKAGELCERFDHLYLVDGDRVVDEVATYRGEGRNWL
jgi:D-serine deaminase-like pyridoxal phosphate-dependent protein